MSHRQPPLPESMKAHSVPGCCRWCGLGMLDAHGLRLKRRTWHPECVKVFKLVCWPAETRRAVFDRDRGVCARCGDRRERLHTNDWQHDHIVCLKLADPNDLSFWQLGNIQTLCTPCHKRKTKEDLRSIRLRALQCAQEARADVFC